MTTLQVNRNQWWEAKRHNAAMEAEAYRHDVETENLTRQSNEETARANRAKEDIKQEKNRIAEQSNQLNYQANTAKTLESIRHNQAAEQLSKLDTVLNNERAWKSLSLTEQRNTAQNYLDRTTAQLRATEEALKHLEVKANIPQAQAAYYNEQVRRSKRELAFAREKFERDNQYRERDLTLQEQKNASEKTRNSAGEFQSIARGVADLGLLVLRLLG